jgi:Uma2 family endonuclease
MGRGGGKIPGMSLSADLRSRRFTFAEYAAMGGLPKHTELLDGRLSLMSPRGDPHSLVCSAIHAALNCVLGAAHLEDDLVVVSEPTLRLSEKTGVEPDIALIDGPITRYVREKILPPRVRLIVEVGETSLARDLGDKLRRYARAGIPEYWVADIGARSMHAFAGPQGIGYDHTSVHASGEVASRTIPAVRVDLAKVFAAVTG